MWWILKILIAELLQSTSKWLQKWTGQPSLEGYQGQNQNRVKNMAAAAYATIQECNITYANPPSSFEVFGQRVRLCDTVSAQGYTIKYENRQEEDITECPKEIGYTLDFGEISRTNNVTKQAQWERKLLDLSMRNMLINMRLIKSVVPLLTAGAGVLEDALADGEEFQVTARPLEWD